MNIKKIDVCIVTRDAKCLEGNWLPKIFEYIPVNNLIVETSNPIGLARYRAIKRVETKYFAFIDDDIIIDKEWFEILTFFIRKKDVGAVWGWVSNEGLGIFDKSLFDNQKLKVLNVNERWNTSNSIIKTNLVRDWIPDKNLRCYEDDAIGKHIMNKGYKVMFVPSNSIHYKNWRRVKESASWAGREWYNYYKPTLFMYLNQYIKLILTPFKAVFNRGIFYSIFITYRNFFYLVGMIQSDCKRLRK